MSTTAAFAARPTGWSGVERRNARSVANPATTLMRAGGHVARYGLAVVFVWIGLLKFTAYEAKNIEPMVANSPIWAWLLQSIGLQNLSNLIGVIEISVGVLIATHAFAPKLSALGSLGAVVTFLITLSFMLTTPGVWEPGYGFGFPSALPGQFLAKDLVLLGVSLWTAGEAFVAARVGVGRPLRPRG